MKDIVQSAGKSFTHQQHQESTTNTQRKNFLQWYCTIWSTQRRRKKTNKFNFQAEIRKSTYGYYNNENYAQHSSSLSWITFNTYKHITRALIRIRHKKKKEENNKYFGFIQSILRFHLIFILLTNYSGKVSNRLRMKILNGGAQRRK